MTQTTEQGSSLEEAGRAITGLLSGKPEDTQSATTQPEQEPKEAPEQAPAAPDPKESESEQAEPEDAKQSDEDHPQPRSFKVKVNGQEVEVTEDEVLKGYSRTEDYTRKTQQLAEQRKTFEEQEVAAVRAERHQYATYLEQLKSALTTLTPQEPDWATLRAQVAPDVFAAELLNWQQTQKRIESVTAEQTKVKAQQDRDAEAGFQRYVTQEQEKLAQAIPEWSDPEKGTAIKTSLNRFAKERGFTDEDLSHVTDHRLVLLLHDAMQFQQGKAKAPAIANKIERAIETSKPGSRTTTQKPSELAAATARLRQSHSVEDAGSAITALLNRKK